MQLSMGHVQRYQGGIGGLLMDRIKRCSLVRFLKISLAGATTLPLLLCDDLNRGDQEEHTSV